MKSTRRSLFILFAAAGLAIAPVSAHAFGLSGVGGKLGFINPDGADGALAFGGHLEFEQRGSQWHLLPNVLVWSSDGVTDINPNFDVYYHFNREGKMTPYLGGGVGLHAYSFDGPADGETDFGLNLLGGVRFPGQSTHFFVEGRYAITDINQLGILGGVTFHLGH